MDFADVERFDRHLPYRTHFRKFNMGYAAFIDFFIYLLRSHRIVIKNSSFKSWDWKLSKGEKPIKIRCDLIMINCSQFQKILRAIFRWEIKKLKEKFRISIYFLSWNTKIVLSRCAISNSYCSLFVSFLLYNIFS